jgi:hypothetical protein
LVWVSASNGEAVRAVWSERIARGRFARVYGLDTPEARAWVSGLTTNVKSTIVEILTVGPSGFPWRRIHEELPRTEILVVTTAEFLTKALTHALGAGACGTEFALEPGSFSIVDIDGNGIALRAANWPEPFSTP